MNRIVADLKNISFRDLNYKEIGLWPRGLRQLILIIFSVTLLFFGSRTVIQDRTNFRSDAEAEITRLQDQMKTQYQLINQLSQYQEQVTELENTLANRFEQIPERNQIGTSIEEISRSGTENDIVFQSITPGTVKEDSLFHSAPISISFSGRYESILKFLAQLSKTKLSLTFEELSIDSSGINQKGDTDLTDPSLNVNMVCNIFWKAPSVKKV